MARLKPYLAHPLSKLSVGRCCTPYGKVHSARSFSRAVLRFYTAGARSCAIC